MTQLTRQTTGGHRKEGGLFIGEMERDGLISHGISGFVPEKLMAVQIKIDGRLVKNVVYFRSILNE